MFFVMRDVCKERERDICCEKDSFCEKVCYREYLLRKEFCYKGYLSWKNAVREKKFVMKDSVVKKIRYEIDSLCVCVWWGGGYEEY